MSHPDIEECRCGSPDAAHRCLRAVLDDVETAVSDIRDVALAPSSSPLAFQLVPYALVGAAWGWGISQAGLAPVGASLHGALWPLSAAFLVARWLAGGLA